MYAEKASQAIGSVPLIVTGGFRSRDAMEQALAEGSLDLVGIAKPFALIPDLPQRMLLGWYAYQMKLINTGNAPQPKRSAWAELFRLLKNIRQHRLRSERA